VLEFPLPDSCIFFLHLLPPCNIFLHIWLFFAMGSIHQEAQSIKFNCNCTSDFTDYSYLLQISSSIAIVLQVLTDCICLLPFFNFKCYLYLRTFQASIVFYQVFKLNCNRNSGLFRLQLFSKFFCQVQRVFPGFYLVINI
jgi:hypothetical protein